MNVTKYCWFFIKIERLKSISVIIEKKEYRGNQWNNFSIFYLIWTYSECYSDPVHLTYLSSLSISSFVESSFPQSRNHTPTAVFQIVGRNANKLLVQVSGNSYLSLGILPEVLI